MSYCSESVLVVMGISCRKPGDNGKCFDAVLLQFNCCKWSLVLETCVTRLLNLLETGGTLNQLLMTEKITQNWIEASLEIFPCCSEELLPCWNKLDLKFYHDNSNGRQTGLREYAPSTKVKFQDVFIYPYENLLHVIILFEHWTILEEQRKLLRNSLVRIK